MSSIQEEVRKTAAELLDQHKADVVIGFSAGTLPMRAVPWDSGVGWRAMDSSLLKS